MTDTFITQCPHCQTSFRLKHSQLNAAQGAVRCGACLQVFNAAQQLSQPTAQPLKAEPSAPIQAVTHAEVQQTEPAQTAAAALSKPLMIHDDMDLADLDDLDLDEELARLEQEEQQRAQQLSGAFSALQDSDLPSPAPIEDTLEHSSTASFDDLSDELMAQEPVAQLSSEPEEPAQSAAIVEPLLIDLPVAQQLATPADTAAEQPLPDSTAEVVPTELNLYAEPRQNDLPYFADEPLRLDWQPKKSPFKRWLGWGLLNVLALLLLAGQYTYNNFTQLARQDNTRPWLEMLCPLIDCQLPSKVDISQIKSSNLLVRSHPEFNGALLVDAIIYNRASFSQPFPLLQMTFSDQQNHPIASRSFKPSEYLGGELAGQNNMPPQTPIHIALEVLEPEGGAINYTLDFVSPD